MSISNFQGTMATPFSSAHEHGTFTLRRITGKAFC